MTIPWPPNGVGYDYEDNPDDEWPPEPEEPEEEFFFERQPLDSRFRPKNVRSRGWPRKAQPRRRTETRPWGR